MLEQALKEKKGEYWRIYDSDKKIWANVVIVPYKEAGLGFHTVDEFSSISGSLVHPGEVVSEKYKDQKGIIFNGGYFLTRKLIENFNKTQPGYTIPEGLEGNYLGFLKKGDKVYPPLYNKGAILITTDGKIYMDRVRLAGGKLKIGTQEVDVKVNEPNPGSTDIVVYTPDYEREMRGELLEEFKQALIGAIDSIDEGKFVLVKEALKEKIRNASSYKEVYKWLDPYRKGTWEKERDSLKELIKKFVTESKFNLKVPKRENVVNIVIVGDTIVAIDETGGQTVIPPFGWVISMPKGVYEKIKDSIKVGSEFRLFKPEIKYENNDIKFEDIKLAIGGLTLLPDDFSQNGINEVMKKEGATLISSRRTQETDFAMIDDRGPRQVIGLVEKGGDQYLMVFTVSGRNKEYTEGANFMQLIELIKKEIAEKGYELKGMINLDGGSSVSTSYFTNNTLYTISLPGPGPNSKSNQVRAVNSVFVVTW